MKKTQRNVITALKIYHNGCKKSNRVNCMLCPMNSRCHYEHGGFSPHDAAEIFLGGLYKIGLLEKQYAGKF